MKEDKLAVINKEIVKDIMVVEELGTEIKDLTKFPFKASRWFVQPGETSPVDQHSVRECWFIASGQGSLKKDDNDPMEVGAGDAIWFDSNEAHAVTNTGQEKLHIFSVWW